MGSAGWQGITLSEKERAAHCWAGTGTVGTHPPDVKSQPAVVYSKTSKKSTRYQETLSSLWSRAVAQGEVQGCAVWIPDTLVQQTVCAHCP